MKILERFYPLLELAEEKRKKLEEQKYRNIDTVIITGGRNSFKSYHVSLISVLWLVIYDWKILYSRYTWASARDSIIEEVREKINILNFSNRTNIIEDRIVKLSKIKKKIETLPAIVFKGVKTSAGNQTATLKSLKGFNCFILEEGEEHPSFKDWKKVKRSIRSLDKRNISIIVLNPTTKLHWIYKEFFEKKGIDAGFNGCKDNVMYIHSYYYDNLDWVSPENLLDFETLKKENSEAYKQEILGGFKDKSEGVIFKNWEYGLFNDSLPYYLGLDFGVNDPDAFVKASIDHKNRIIYVKELIYQNNLSTDSLIDIIEKNATKKDLIIADSSGARTIKDLRLKGYNVRAVVKPKVVDMIKTMLNYKIIITSESINLAREFNNYVWADKVSETPLQNGQDHLIDSLRYAISLELRK